jgi:hypothetical protein
MKFVRIGNRILNANAIVAIHDQGEKTTTKGVERVVEIELLKGAPLKFAGTEAEAILARCLTDIEVWLDSHSPPEFPIVFGSR